MTQEEAIKIFRKEIECLSHTKCEDCILEKACDPMNTTPYDSKYIEAYSMAIKALEQEPITKNDLGVLDRVRAEIETKYGQCDICEYFEDYDFDENDISEYRPIGNIADILQIIDKYKAESEDKE